MKNCNADRSLFANILLPLADLSKQYEKLTFMASLNTLRTKFGVVLSIIIGLALLAFILSLKTEMGFRAMIRASA